MGSVIAQPMLYVVAVQERLTFSKWSSSPPPLHARLSHSSSAGDCVVNEQNDDRANDCNNHAVDIEASDAFSTEEGEKPKFPYHPPN